MITNNRISKIIYVDADACPVKSEIALIAEKFGWKVMFIASYDHISFQQQIDGEWIFVDPGKDAVDLYILNHIKNNQILITQDLGLASLGLRKGVFVLSPRGTEYKEESIDIALQFRYLHAKERQRGIYGKGPSPFTDQDRKRFSESLCELLSKIEGD